MSTMFRSLRCSRKGVQRKGGRRPDCGSGFMDSREQTHFLSGLPLEKGKAFTLPAGTMLMDRFRIEKHIGNGRYGSVYLAEDVFCSM